MEESESEKASVKVDNWTVEQECAESTFLCKAETNIPRYDETEAYSENEVDIRITVGWSKDLPRGSA